MRGTMRAIEITYFYPRSPCGERQGASARIRPVIYFYPRSPCGERLWVLRKVPLLGIFLSTLSLRRATHYDNYNLHCVEISIHALLAESDLGGMSERLIGSVFLSTLSLRRATKYAPLLLTYHLISIHALLAESDNRGAYHVKRYEISIHALLAESDHSVHRDSAA